MVEDKVQTVLVKRLSKVCLEWGALGDRVVSRSEVCRAMGYSSRNIFSRLETGKLKNIRLDSLAQAAQYLQCTTDYLLGLSDVGPDYSKGWKTKRKRKVAGTRSRA